MSTEQEQPVLHQMPTPLCKVAWWIHTQVSSVVPQCMKWDELQVNTTGQHSQSRVHSKMKYETYLLSSNPSLFVH